MYLKWIYCLNSYTKHYQGTCLGNSIPTLNYFFELVLLKNLNHGAKDGTKYISIVIQLLAKQSGYPRRDRRNIRITKI